MPFLIFLLIIALVIGIAAFVMGNKIFDQDLQESGTLIILMALVFLVYVAIFGFLRA